MDAFARPYVAACAVMIVAALLTLVNGLVRGARLGRFLAAALFVCLASVALLPLEPSWTRAATIGAALAWLAHLISFPTIDLGDGGNEPRAARSGAVYAAVAFGIAAVMLFCDLGGFAGSLLVWEGGIVQGFKFDFLRGTTASDFAARQLLWNSAVLSEGHASLLYGAPTYALMKTFGFSTWTLRVVSAVCTLWTIAAAYALGRRFFGPPAGSAIAVAFALHTGILFYGRYGTSMAATLLTATLLLLATWTFLEDDRSAWWMGAVVAAVAYAATLEYATGRLVVIAVLAVVLAASVLGVRRLSFRRLIGVVLLAAAVSGVWWLQGHYGARHALLEARGEQFLVFSRSLETYQVELGRRPERIEWRDQIELARRIVSQTLPQYLARVLPRPLADQVPLFGDEERDQPLYHAPLVVLLLLGAARSIRGIRRWPHVTLFCLVAGISVAVLLTTGADSHRLAILAVPFCIWIGLGAAEAARIMSAARVPRLLRHAVAAALALCVVFALRRQLHSPQAKPVRAMAVLESIDRVSGPVYIAGNWDSSELGWVLLSLIDRNRLDPSATVDLLHPELVFAAANEGPVRDEDLEKLARLARESTLIFTPAERFRPAVPVLERHGVAVIEEGPEDFRILRTSAKPAGA